MRSLTAFALQGILSVGVLHAQSAFPNADARYWLGPTAKERQLVYGADLSGLDLRGFILYGENHFYRNISFEGSNLSGADLEGGDPLWTEFRECNFREAIIRRVAADWSAPAPWSDFTDADISGSRIHLDTKQLRSTWNYKNRDLSHTTIRLSTKSTMEEPGLDFAGFNLRGTEFIYGRTTLFDGADFTHADISGASIRLTSAQLRSTKNFQGKDLAGITLTGDFAGVSFCGFNLRNTAFMFCNLKNCEFTDAEICGMRVYGSGWYTAEGQQWTTSLDPSASRFTKEQLYSTRNYRRRDLECVQFHGCDFRNADFANQTLGYFERCELRGADFTNADHITGPGDVRTQRSDSPAPIGFSCCNLTREQFCSTRIYSAKRFQVGCKVCGLDLRGWDFSGFDLRFARFDGSLVENARLEDARGGDFSGAKGLSISQVRSMWNFKNDQMDFGFEFALPREIREELAEGKPQPLN